MSEKLAYLENKPKVEINSKAFTIGHIAEKLGLDGRRLNNLFLNSVGVQTYKIDPKNSRGILHTRCWGEPRRGETYSLAIYDGEYQLYRRRPENNELIYTILPDELIKSRRQINASVTLDNTSDITVAQLEELKSNI